MFETWKISMSELTAPQEGCICQAQETGSDFCKCSTFKKMQLISYGECTEKWEERGTTARQLEPVDNGTCVSCQGE